MAAGRVPTVAQAPAGLAYVPGFVTEAEESELVAAFEAADFEEVRMRGQAALRTVLHFGHRYEYEGWRLVPAEPLPSSLGWLRERAAALAEVGPEDFDETLVTRYPRGAGIGWHRDAPLFGPKVVGVSLLAPCRMRFQRRTADLRRAHELELAPRSAYVLAGAARWSWQHSIPPIADLRYSVTFRTVVRTGG
ncbi:MAG: alpha-ketoglutarate-dependent dioxygenase AlkB [Actinomycetota bacterium]|nr:alpha-ketoglutarate-dependent dioxygenase AlkB [Actinomycetota bacterium]